MPKLPRAKETPQEDNAQNIKIGMYQQKDERFTAFVQLQNIPTEEQARQAAEWFADLLSQCATPKEETIQ